MAAVGLDSVALVERLAPVTELAKSLGAADLTKPPYGCEVRDEEEELCSVRFGLVGRTDVTLFDGKFIPLEMKSGASLAGKGRAPHVTQLTAYILMMKEKYAALAEDYGMLFYMSDGVSVKVKPCFGDLQELIALRNALISSQMDGALPPVPCDPRSCDVCHVRPACTFLARADDDFAGLLYRRFDDALQGQMRHERQQQAYIWTTSLQYRVERGAAVDGLTLEASESGNFVFHSMGFFNAKFRRFSTFTITRGGLPPIIGYGKVYGIDLPRVEVKLRSLEVRVGETDLVIDFFEQVSLIQIARSNLILFFAFYAGDRRLRRLVVEGRPPRFRDFGGEAMVSGMNRKQQEAIKKGITARDYLVINGVRRSGKTLVLANLATHFVSQGRRILVVGDSDAAADHFCLQLLDQVNFMRVTRRDTVTHPSIVPFTNASVLASIRSDADYCAVLDGCQVFVTTLSECRHDAILRRTFDVLLVDNAETISTPLMLGALVLAAAFIMAGDLRVSSTDSMLRHLANLQPGFVIGFTTQYGIADPLVNEALYPVRVRHGGSPGGGVALREKEFHRMHGSWLAIRPDNVCVYDTRLVCKAEAAVVGAIVVSLLVCGTDADAIGVVTANRLQVYRVRRAIEGHLSSAVQYFPRELEDGAAMQAMIECCSVGDFRQDVEYLMKQLKVVVACVAGNGDQDVIRVLTYATSKLIIVGDAVEMRRTPALEPLLSRLDAAAVLEVPAGIMEVDTEPFLSMTKIISEISDS
jgi:DNA replication ATP-dependent helicase Dna2